MYRLLKVQPSPKRNRAIDYKSGRVDSIEVAVRRAVVPGANQTAAKAQEALADELGVDLVKVTAHGGARPEHAKWQGKCYSRKGRKVIDGVVYEDFETATRYGHGDGLCVWNCRHNFHPYIHGAPRTWSDKTLKDLNKKDIEYNGKKYTEYEVSQLQREIERDIRSLKRQVASIEAGGGDASAERAKLRKASKAYTNFTEQTGLKKQQARTKVATGTGTERPVPDSPTKITKTKAHNLGNMSIENNCRNDIISNIDSPIEQRRTGEGTPSAIVHFDIDLNKRQQKLLDNLPEYDSRATVPKKSVNMKDLSALTAKTGVEYAMFTKGNERLIVRGNATNVNIDNTAARELIKSGYKWSGHTHPGTDKNVLQASSGDYSILKLFGQPSSVIYNSLGEYFVFWVE